jgi:hypothetical protein
VVELWVQIAGTVSSKIDPKSVAFALVTEIEGILSLAKNTQNPEALTIGARNLCVTLPAGVGFNYAEVTGITGTAGACTEDAMVVTCRLPNFDKSTGYTLSVIVNVNAPPTVGTFSNTGIITSTTPDPQPANNRVTVTAQVKTPLAACVLPRRSSQCPTRSARRA